MKKILGIIVFLALTGVVYSAPCDYENQNAHPGIPMSSCQLGVSNYHIGIQVNGLFFVDTEEDVSYNGKNYRLRFYVTSARPDYNAIQALAQTAFACRDQLNVIFPNFTSTTVNSSCNSFDNTNCCTNVDGAGNPANMYCPIQAITVHK